MAQTPYERGQQEGRETVQEWLQAGVTPQAIGATLGGEWMETLGRLREWQRNEQHTGAMTPELLQRNIDLYRGLLSSLD